MTNAKSSDSHHISRKTYDAEKLRIVCLNIAEHLSFVCTRKYGRGRLKNLSRSFYLHGKYELSRNFYIAIW